MSLTTTIHDHPPITLILGQSRLFILVVMPPKKRTKTTHGRRTLASSKGAKTTDSNVDATTTVIRRNVRAKQGVLEGMPDMPLDVLFEVRMYAISLSIIRAPTCV